MLSIPHLIIIFLVAFIVLGPEKLPQVARVLGKTMAEFRRITADFRTTIEGEMREMERQTQLRQDAAAVHAEVNTALETIGSATPAAPPPAAEPEPAAPAAEPEPAAHLGDSEPAPQEPEASEAAPEPHVGSHGEAESPAANEAASSEKPADGQSHFA